MIDVHHLDEIRRRMLPNLEALEAVRRAYSWALPEGITMPPQRPSYVPPAEQRPAGGTFQKPDLIAAVLASGMIAASEKEHTAEEAVAVYRGVKAVLDGSSPTK